MVSTSAFPLPSKILQRLSTNPSPFIRLVALQKPHHPIPGLGARRLRRRDRNFARCTTTTAAASPSRSGASSGALRCRQRQHRSSETRPAGTPREATRARCCWREEAHSAATRGCRGKR
jgi:hypothetical protein